MTRLRSSRRGFLAGAAASAGAGALLRGLEADAAGTPPTRILIVHRPCGTRPENFFPPSDQQLTAPRILKALEPHRQDVMILDRLNSPKSRTRGGGDEHTIGLAMNMTGYASQLSPGIVVNGEPLRDIGTSFSFEQFLLRESPFFKGTPVPYVTLMVGRSRGKYPGGIMSYSGPREPVNPMLQPQDVYMRLFGASLPAGNKDADGLARVRAQKKSVIDFVRRDITRLSATAPAAQRAKLDQHLQAIRETERLLDPPAISQAQCANPMVNLTEDPASAFPTRGRQMFEVIKTGFLCDLTRIALFQWDHTNSSASFDNLIPGCPRGGHHGMSHNSAGQNAINLIDTWYVERLAEMLTSLKNTPEGSGTMLDNTLVVFMSEVSIGYSHSHENMPVILAGRAGGRVKPGRILRAGGRTMNDLWTAIAALFGVNKRFGDPALGDGDFPSLA